MIKSMESLSKLRTPGQLTIRIMRYICEQINNLLKMNQITKKVRVILGITVAIIIVAGALSSCEKFELTYPKISTTDSLHFSMDIQPIFNGICINCHNGSQSPDLREGKSYNSLSTGGYINLPGETSRLYLKVTSTSHFARTTDIQKQEILLWLNQGAKNN